MSLIQKLASLRLPCVVGEGPKRVKLLILGEALGEQEVIKLRPFVGGAGWMFDDILRCAGIPRSECYIMNVIPTRPPENKVPRLLELGITLEECEEWCREWIADIHPTCVLALGGTALRCLTGQVDITAWRGSILNVDVSGGIKVKVIPTFHPSYIRRLSSKSARKEREGEQTVKYTYGSARLTAVIDAKRAWEESKKPGFEQATRELIVQPTLAVVKEYLAKARSAKRVSFDIETMGKWVDCIGFSDDSRSAICIPRGEYWGKDSPEIDALIREILWEHDGLVAQNGAFDMTMLLGNELPVRKLHFDTMVAHHWLHPELPHDLHYLTSIYTKEPYYKWKLRSARNSWERWEYNCLDACTTLEVAEKLGEELKEFKVENEFYGYIMPLFHTVLRMGLRGCRVDLERKKRLQRVLGYLVDRRVKRAKELLGVDINLNSPVQLIKYLYTDLKLPVQKNRDNYGKFVVTADEDAIKRLIRISGKRELQSILDVREVRKAKSTYADAKLSFDGRLRTGYSVTGTETGRLNSKKNLFKEGWNSQNSPPWFRSVVIPEEGHVLLEADLKFAEALLIAWFARDIATIDAVRNGRDIYLWHGSRMFGKDYSAVTAEERDLIKPVILGCGYGLGPNHLAEMLGVSVAKGKVLRELFFSNCPAIRDYQEWVKKCLKETRTLVTPFNRRRVFLGRLYISKGGGQVVENEELFRSGYAYLPQSCCAEYLNRGMIRTELQLPGEAKLLLQVHDAMLLSVPKELEEEVKGIITRELAVPIIIWGEPLVIPVEFKRSERSWGEMKKVGIFNT